MTTGIYKIVNKINNKVYIGSSVNIRTRWRTHISQLMNNTHKNSHLQDAWDKHGEKNFEFKVILLCEKFELFRYEQWFLDSVVRWEHDYNEARCAEASFRGRKHTEETKRKLSEANIGKIFSEEHKRKISESKKGTVCSEETKRKISETKKGISIHTKESKRKLSIARIGKNHTEGTKKKMSVVRKGKYAGENNPNSKLIKERILMIRRMYLLGKYTQETLGKLFSVSRPHINAIINYKKWNTMETKG